jgi:hypothetical protein
MLRALLGELPEGVIVTPPGPWPGYVTPGTIERMRLAEACQHTMDAVRSGELQHG